MGLFAFSRKTKQEPASGDGEFYSRAEEESTAVRSRGKRKANQANDPVDPVLPEKKRARRRLVGAIALVLAAIIGLPMIFDSEPKPVADDIAIQIPSKDKPVNKSIDRNQTAGAVPTAAGLDPKEEIVAPNSATSPVSASPAVVAGGVATAAAAAVAKKDIDKNAETATSTNIDKTNKKSGSDSENKSNAASEQKQAQKINAKPEAKSAPLTEQKSSEASKTKGISKDSKSGTVTAKITADRNSGKYALQVAALVTQEKINELQGKLKKAGFTTYTQKVPTESGFSTRVRVGPYATKEEADKARAKLSKMGLNGTPVPGH
jgi:DedD protein